MKNKITNVLEKTLFIIRSISKPLAMLDAALVKAQEWLKDCK